MKLGTTTHPKFCRLMRRLSLSRFSTVGVLESLWMMASQFTDDGDLSRFGVEDIAAYIDWPDEPQQLVDALIQCGWLDRDDDRLRVHDFDEHKPNFINDRIRKREQRAAEQSKRSMPEQPVPSLSRDCPGTPADNRTESPLFQSSPAQPSQVQKDKAPSGSRSEQALSGFHFPIKEKGGGTWTLPLAKLNEYVDTFGDLRWVETELKKSRQWCVDNPAKRKTRSGMEKFLTRWLSGANDRGRSRPLQTQQDELPELESRGFGPRRRAAK